MSVLVVEPNEGLQELLELAIEAVSPGMPVTVQRDPVSAARGLEKLKGKASLKPRVVVLGPSAAASISDQQVNSLRKALGPQSAIVALSVRPELEQREVKGLDAVYEHPFDWKALSTTIAQVIDKWSP